MSTVLSTPELLLCRGSFGVYVCGGVKGTRLMTKEVCMCV